MQVQDEEKRRKIAAAAGKLFAQRQFHKVCLEDVASEAGVGKGTLYTYFASKEDLYLSILEDALGQLVDLLKSELEGRDRPSGESLALIVRGLVDYAASHAYLFELMRSGAAALNRPRWNKTRQALTTLIEQSIREGVRRGELSDPHPELTALFIPGLIRSALWCRAPLGNEEERRNLAEHILRFVKQGVGCKEEA